MANRGDTGRDTFFLSTTRSLRPLFPAPNGTDAIPFVPPSRSVVERILLTDMLTLRLATKEQEMADTITAAPELIARAAPARAMTIFAHPDDAEFCCAGTLALWARQGAEITMVIITDASKGSDDRSISDEQLVVMRIAEQGRAAAVLGVTRVIRLGYEDGILQPTIALRRDLARVVRQYRPEIVITMDPDIRFGGDFYINHPDHRAAGEAALYGIFPAAGNHRFYPELLAEGLEPYKVREVWIEGMSGGPVSVCVDVTEAMEAKITALAAHVGQFAIGDVEPFVRQWTEEMGRKVGVPFAESYHRITLEQPSGAAESAEAAPLPDPSPARRGKGA
jgi:LmbE family N-acetylglucosaminyl deacetylase